MTKHTLKIKANRRFIHLLQDLSHIAKETVKKNNVGLSWLSFAKRTLNSYHFQKFQKQQQKMLEEIITNTSQKHPNITTARVVDVLSELVNTTVQDAIIVNGLVIPKQLDFSEKAYSHTPLIDLVGSIHYIPRHPWLMPHSHHSEEKWQAKDILDENIVWIYRMLRGDFVEYDIQQLRM